MAESEAIGRLPDNFSGVVRLFPLPNLVMFPGVMQPLHIFEPRYCEMLEDALAKDKLIAMALLEPGWESDYEGQPPTARVICAGRVVNHAPTGDGQHNILLLGLKRARIIRELPMESSFRTAELEPLEDVYPASDGVRRQALRRRIIATFRQHVPSASAAQKQFDQWVTEDIPLGFLTDLVAYTISLEISLKQELLAECNVDRRADLVLNYLSDLSANQGGEDNRRGNSFPPDFSQN